MKQKESVRIHFAIPNRSRQSIEIEGSKVTIWNGGTGYGYANVTKALEYMNSLGGVLVEVTTSLYTEYPAKV